MANVHRGGFGAGPLHTAPAADIASSNDDARKHRTGGAASKAPKHVVAAQARYTRFDGSAWCPPWIRKLVVGGASVDAVVEAATKRAKGHVTEETLVEVETLLNEIGKDPRHAEIVRAAVSKDTVAYIMKKGAAS